VKIIVISSIDLVWPSDYQITPIYNLESAWTYSNRAINADSSFKEPDAILIDCNLLDDPQSLFTKPKGLVLAENFVKNNRFATSKIGVFNIEAAEVHNTIMLSGLEIRDRIYYFPEKYLDQDGNLKNDYLESILKSIFK
jgi:hypothetical protein